MKYSSGNNSVIVQGSAVQCVEQVLMTGEAKEARDPPHCPSLPAARAIKQGKVNYLWRRLGKIQLKLVGAQESKNQREKETQI